MRLLVSVADAGEARAAVAGRADIVDAKNPAEGSLGAPTPATIEAVRGVVPGHLPLSVAIGDLPHLPGTAALAALGAARAGASYVKVGLRGSATEQQAVALLRAVREAVSGSSTAVIAAGYADARRLTPAALSPWLLPAVACAAGVSGCLLDTAVKDGRGLFEWVEPFALAEFVAEAHAGGLEVALAGGLGLEDFDAVRATGADIVGVRSAACRGGVRTGPLDALNVRRLRRSAAR